jgi:ribosomal protein L31E
MKKNQKEVEFLKAFATRKKGDKVIVNYTLANSLKKRKIVKILTKKEK